MVSSTFFNNTFQQNSLITIRSYSINIDQITFNLNNCPSCDEGSALNLNRTYGTMSKSNFFNNTASTAGAINIAGAALKDIEKINFSFCTFINNKAIKGGGGVV